MNSGQGSSSSQNFVLNVPLVNKVDGTEIKLPIFNRNGLEDPKQHWFICEFLWILRQIQDENVKKAHMITTLRGHALEWYMKFSIVPVGFA